MSRPNILFIMSDEHDAGVTGCYGNDIVNTPHMDWLAEEGIRFASHYPATESVPNRAMRSAPGPQSGRGTE
ncbi:MAG: sulfatase-like hydrolase/transferase [Armatimonadota bacterium]